MSDEKHSEIAIDETEFMPLSEAAKLTGYTPEYLNLLSRTKKFQAKKIGRNWYTKKAWLGDFLASRGDSQKLEKFNEAISLGKEDSPERISSRGSEQFFSEDANLINEAVSEEVKKIKELKAFGFEDGPEKKKERNWTLEIYNTNWQSSNRWLKMFAIMSAAVIVLPVLFAGSQSVKVILANSQKKQGLADIYNNNQSFGTKILNENTEKGQVAGIETTQDNSHAILASANFKINSINVGGNTLVLSNEDNQPLTIENIKSDSFADNKKNETSLVVAWQTNKMSLSELAYSKTGGQNPATLAEDSYGFNHSAVVSGLEPGASYVFQIKSKDRWANETNSDFFGVYTASKPVSVFDLISNAVGEVFGWAIKK